MHNFWTLVSGNRPRVVLLYINVCIWMYHASSM